MATMFVQRIGLLLILFDTLVNYTASTSFTFSQPYISTFVFSNFSQNSPAFPKKQESTTFLGIPKLQSRD